MRKLMYLILVSIIVVLGILLVKGDKGDRGNGGDGGNRGNEIFQTQTSSEGEVTVEVTPIVLSDKENVKFKIVLNTHSVVLDKDLKEISVLLDDQNNQYKPISWSGGTGGSPRLPAGEAGHHLEGILAFPPLSKETRLDEPKVRQAKTVKIVIKGIADINRVFSFELD